LAKIIYELTKWFGFRWQGAPSKDVSGKYRVWFAGETTFGQCTCLYAWVGLVVYFWWVENRCKSKKKKLWITPVFSYKTIFKRVLLTSVIGSHDIMTFVKKFKNGNFILEI